MKKISRHELMQYGTAVISFLIVMTFTLLIFFWFVQQSVDKSKVLTGFDSRNDIAEHPVVVL